jgi:hypothetical protein
MAAASATTALQQGPHNSIGDFNRVLIIQVGFQKGPIIQKGLPQLAGREPAGLPVVRERHQRLVQHGGHARVLQQPAAREKNCELRDW